MEVDADGIRWQRGELEVGSWPLSQVRSLRRSTAWNHSYRFELQQEFIILASLGVPR